jgi:hypothetical protein
MSKGTFLRWYRTVMREALQPCGFRSRGGLFFRERDGLLHLLSLDRSPLDGAFTLDIAVQPLALPFETFDLSLGARLDRLAPQIPARWRVPSTEAELKVVLGRFVDVVVEAAVPWLDRFVSVRDLVEIDRTRDWGISRGPGSPAHRYLAVGLSALDAGLYDRARTLLERAYEAAYARVGQADPEWMRERKQMIRTLLTLLEEGNIPEIRRQVEEYKDYTRQALDI